MTSQSPYQRPAIRPPSPAPNLTPKYCKIAQTRELKEQFLSQHMRLYIYVWTVSRHAFWMYPLEMGGGFLVGYVWQNQSWQPIKLRLSQIDSFC